MTLEDFYGAIGGSYETVKKHLQRDTLIQRLVMKFPADKSFEKLKEALEDKAYEDAFRASHTLKGVSLNLSFANLSKSATELTESLRNHSSRPVDEAVCQKLFSQVAKDYQEVMDGIQGLSDTAGQA